MSGIVNEESGLKSAYIRGNDGNFRSLAASGTSWGLLTTDNQEIKGEKTFLDKVIFNDTNLDFANLTDLPIINNHELVDSDGKKSGYDYGNSGPSGSFFAPISQGEPGEILFSGATGVDGSISSAPEWKKATFGAKDLLFYDPWEGAGSDNNSYIKLTKSPFNYNFLLFRLRFDNTPTFSNEEELMSPKDFLENVWKLGHKTMGCNYAEISQAGSNSGLRICAITSATDEYYVEEKDGSWKKEDNKDNWKDVSWDNYACIFPKSYVEKEQPYFYVYNPSDESKHSRKYILNLRAFYPNYTETTFDASLISSDSSFYIKVKNKRLSTATRNDPELQKNILGNGTSSFPEYAEPGSNICQIGKIGVSVGGSDEMLLASRVSKINAADINAKLGQSTSNTYISASTVVNYGKEKFQLNCSIRSDQNTSISSQPLYIFNQADGQEYQMNNARLSLSDQRIWEVVDAEKIVLHQEPSIDSTIWPIGDVPYGLAGVKGRIVEIWGVGLVELGATASNNEIIIDQAAREQLKRNEINNKWLDADGCWTMFSKKTDNGSIKKTINIFTTKKTSEEISSSLSAMGL